MPGRLHVIHGFIGSGKTTLAKRLERDLPGLRFTPDEWMTALYGTDPPAERFAEYHARIATLLEGQILRCLELGLQVVHDGGAWQRGERDRLRALAASVGAAFTLYDLSVPDEVALGRVLQRNHAQPGHLYIAENTFWLLRERFEPLGDDEPAVAVAPGAPT